MKYLAILALIIVTHQFSFSQDEKSSSQVLYLSDGSKLKGTILHTDSLSGILDFHLKSGVSLQIPMEDIIISKKNNKDFRLAGNRRLIQQKGRYVLPQIYLFTAERAKSQEDPEDELRYSLGSSLSMGYFFNQYFAIGGGIGIDLQQHVLMPVFAEIRGQLTKSSPSLVYSFGGGYSFPIGEWIGGNEDQWSVQGGWFYQPSIGLKFIGREQISFQFDLGYHIQHLQRDSFGWWGENFHESIVYRSLALRLGVSF